MGTVPSVDSVSGDFRYFRNNYHVGSVWRMKMKRILSVLMVICMIFMTGCDVEATDEQKTRQVAETLKANQSTPTDIDYSLERYNLIKRAYWVNGQREKANAVLCPVQKPLGYIVLFTESGSIVGRFCVDGKVSSLNSYLTPDSEYYELGGSSYYNHWIADVDGSYGENDNGIFFFTVEGNYVEWTGTYLYSDLPFEIDDPVVRIGK